MKTSFHIIRLYRDNLKLFVELVEMFNEVFEEYNKVASTKQLDKLLNNPKFHAIAVIHNDTIIGGLTAYELDKYYSDKSEMYIYDIAVRTKYHNQGIGKALINYLKSYSAINGIESIFVQAYSEEDQAVKFYESTIGSGLKVKHFNFDIETS